MRPQVSCKIFGAHQVLTGIKDAVVLLHSVVGCNFGSMNFHLVTCDMADIHQTCTVVSDSEVVFGGEEHLREALDSAKELYDPKMMFVVNGCVSDMIQDDSKAVSKQFETDTGIRTIAVEAAGYRGVYTDGYDAALDALKTIIKAPSKKNEVPVINIIGLGADDYRLRFDINAIEELFNSKAKLGCVIGSCTISQIEDMANADLNIVIGKGEAFAKYLNDTYNIPYEKIDFPYGLTGAKELWAVLNKHFGLDFASEEDNFRKITANEISRIYNYVQALYGLPCSVIGTSSRARGIARFLSEELGMEIEVFEERESNRDSEGFYDKVLASESSMIFGSSFEQDLSDTHKCPLIRYDYPVFDRVTLSDRPYVGIKGSLCLVEDIFNEVFNSRTKKGALYQ